MSNCPVCPLDFIGNKSCIACDCCDTWYHQSCTSLTTDEFQTHCKNKKLSWICATCEANTHCAKCCIKFIPKTNQKSICCNKCDKFFHLKCSGLTIASFYHLSNSNETWYCRSCKNNIFPFHSIDNNKLLNCMQINVNKIPLPQPSNFHTECSCCSKNVILNHRKILCSNCFDNLITLLCF